MAQQIALNVDCMEYMRTLPDKAFDLAIVDPPYFTGPERRGYYGCIAAYTLGFEFVGCEIEPTYFQLQEHRFAEHTAQERLW